MSLSVHPALLRGNAGGRQSFDQKKVAYMEIGVTSRETALSGLFAQGERLVMPPYQRSYSWGVKEALELLGDFNEAADNDMPHFIGAIVVVREKQDGPLEIVDGQQRLTTLTILLAVLRDLDPDPNERAKLHALIGDEARPRLEEDARWRLTLNHVDGPYFRETVQRQGATLVADRDPGESDSQKRMSENTIAFVKALKDLEPPTRRKLAHTIVHGCGIVRVSVADRDAGYKVFRVLNTRGKEPNSHDIIKTDLFERAKFGITEANKYSSAWSEYEARLGGSGFDDLLRQIRFLYDRGSKGDLVSGFQKAVLAKVNARKFLDDLLPRYVQAYEEISTGNVDYGEKSAEVARYLNRLRALDHYVWRAAALKYLVEQRSSADDAARFFSGLERLAYTIMLVIHNREQRNKRYRKVIDAIGSNRTLFAKKGPFAISKDDARKVRERLRGRFATFGQRRALALRLNAALDGGKDLAPEDDATVEHVLPRNPGQDSPWLRVWPNPHIRRELCDTIGNFVLLPHSVNQKADRMGYQDKKAVYFHEDSLPLFALTRDLETEELWTADVVRTRTDHLADILADDWELP